MQKVDGTGWIPVNLSSLGLISSLPIDPTNSTSSNLYYSYIVNSSGSIELTATLESQKKLKDTALVDGGTDPAKYETGETVALWTQASGLVGWWPFDEKNGTIAVDSSGNGNNGTLSSPAPTWTIGKVGGALSFNGSNTVTFPNISLANMPYTVSAWIYKNDTNDFNIVGGGIGGINANAHYIVRSSKFYFGNYGCDVGGVLTVNPGQWYYVDFVMDSSQKQSIYVNGVLDAGPAYTCGYYQSYVDLVGSSCCGGAGAGLIDDVHIYDRALSATEIQNMYNATK
jgi:hypothetical protein